MSAWQDTRPTLTIRTIAPRNLIHIEFYGPGIP